MQDITYRAQWFSPSHEYRPGAEDSHVKLTLSTGYTDAQQRDVHTTIELTVSEADALIRHLQYERNLIARHESDKVAAGAKPFDEAWVCVDCMLDRECEPGASNRTDGRDSWSTGYIGSVDVTNNFDSNDEVDGGIDTFSRSECPACGSRLGGERYRYAVWVPQPALVLKVDDQD